MIQTKKEPKNKDFYNRVGPFVPYIVAAGIIFQLISALTEAFGIYQFGNVLTNAVWIILGFTIAVVVGWELLIRSSVQYVVRSIVMAIRGEAKLEKLEALLLAIAIMIGSALIYYSYSISKENSYKTFQFLMPDADTTKTNNAIALKNIEIGGINKEYDRRKAEINKMFKSEKNAAYGLYVAAKNKNNQKINEYRAKEKKYNRKYTTYINNHTEAINEAYEKYKKEEAAAVDKQNQKLEQLSLWRSGRESSTLQNTTEAIGEEKNKRALFSEWFQKYSFIWSEFAGLSVVLAVLCVVFVTIFEVLAGIEKEANITPEHFDPSLFSELVYLLQITFLAPLRNAIRRQINRASGNRVQLQILQPNSPSVKTLLSDREIQPILTNEKRLYSTPSGRTVVQPFHNPQKTVEKGLKNHTTTDFQKPVQPQLPTTVVPSTTVVERVENITIPVQPKRVVKRVEKVQPIKAKTPVKNTTVSPPAKVVEIYVEKDGTKTVELDRGNKVEILTLLDVRRRKGAWKSKKPKTLKGTDSRKKWVAFYSGLEKQMKNK